MDVASYDDLLQQVACLKAENSNLRKELASNSKHLNQLGNEASNMKEVITNLQESVTSQQLNTSRDYTNRNDNERLHQRERTNSNGISDNSQLQQLHREKARILHELETEENEKQWFLSCLERINQQLMQLSQSNGYMNTNERSLWQKLQQDAGRLQEAMQQKLGSKGEIERRQEARVHNILLIDKQMEHLCQHDSQQDSFQELNVENTNDEEGCCGRMTTSGTQTMDLYLMNSSGALAPGVDEEHNINSIYNSSWFNDRVLWYSSPSSVGGSIHSFNHDEVGSCKSGVFNYRNRNQNQQQFGTKVEMVYSLLSMLKSQDKDDMSQKLLNMSGSVDSCIAMRQSGCLPLLIELLHGSEENRAEMGRPSREIRRRAAQALQNIIRSHPDDKRGRRETRVLKLLEQVREYCNSIRDSDSGSDEDPASPEAAQGVRSSDQYPVSAVAMLMKLSFDEEHRHTMCQLGGLQALAELIQLDYETHGNVNSQDSITMRRYAGMALTNLTFGDGTNKALLCSNKPFMRALVAQLHSPSEDLRQVTASVLRNLSWRADQASKKALRDIGAVVVLVKAAMEARKESTLKSILSALWNLSAHCSMNKADICSVDGALAFMVTTLVYRSPSKTHAIVENGGGILRNISSHIAEREDYRAILREHNCLIILLQHLRSPSLTIVSNACGTLWNLSARCVEDQQTLWDLGAVAMLRNLVHSKHKMISMGSSAALKNLLQARPGGLAASAEKMLSGAAPSLLVRKQRALEEELDHNLAETCENLDSPKTSPTHHCSERKANRDDRGGKGVYRPAVATGPYQLHGRMYHSVGGQLSPGKVSRSESKDSVLTTKSDSSHDRLKSLNMLLRNRQSHAVNENDEANADQAVQIPQVVLESRIQYVMQEVTRQIAAESGETLGKRDSRASRFLKNANANHSSETGSQCDESLLDKYSSLTTMIEKLDLCEGDNEQPVNYSLKYTEESELINKSNSENSRNKVGEEDIYSHYAETDLDDPDQLTNYSLRYTEDTDTTDHFTPPGPKDEKPYFGSEEYQAKGPSCHDDTVRIYCTEDTPLNFSSATSMTDLRDIQDAKNEKSNTPAEAEAAIKDEASDRTVSYCVEGTPACLSRVSSLSSLHSTPEAVNSHAKTMTVNNKPVAEESPKTKPCIASTPKQHIPIQDSKTVRFEEEQHVEETPLMFSRCSSLGSLSSFDQHSIHDDRSSVVSDFSRRASEVVSPSDLPDSPGETRPFTPPPQPCLSTRPSTQLHVTNGKPSDENDDVFEDLSRVYAVEGTPLQFSQATSLSSLPTSPPVEANNGMGENKSEDNNMEDKVSDCDEDGEGEDLLAACISSAMPNNTRNNAPKKTNVKLVSTVNNLNANRSGIAQRIRTSGIPVKCNNLRGPIRSPLAVTSQFDGSPGNSGDNNSSRDSNSDAGSVLDEDSMLAQCIRSGMPRPVSSKVIDSKKQNYGRNLSEDGNGSTPAASTTAMTNCKTSQLKGEECASANSVSVMRLLDVVKTRTDDKSLAYDSLNRNVESNSSKIDDMKNKLTYSKLGYKSWNDRGERASSVHSNSSFSSNVSRGGRENEEGTERCRQFLVEDTPVCFSANSSLSSLSVDSCGVESTASEQALLDECINSGMPPYSHRMLPKSNQEVIKRRALSKEDPLKSNESAESNDASPDDSHKTKESHSVSDESSRLRMKIGENGADVSLIDNIKPPSLMEDTTDMTSSSYSVASLVSDALESRSESINSDMIMRMLQPVADMFAKDLSGSASNGSGNLSYYEALENINPPSALLEVTGDTLYEVTEVGTETVANGNDTDIEDDLLEDDRACKKSGFKLDSDDSYISPEDVQALKENAELVVTTLNEIQSQNLAADESLSEDMLLECETLSLVSNESDSSFTNSETPSENQSACHGPKIVKPVNRDAVRQLKEEEKVVGIRGRRRVSHSRQQMFISSVTRFSSPKPKEMFVKPTKTSALRTTQSQQKVATSDQRKGTSRSMSNSGSPQLKYKMGNRNSTQHQSGAGNDAGLQPPRPPTKQATFTKDKPSQQSVPKISPTKTRIPTFGNVSAQLPNRWAQPPLLLKEERQLAEAASKSTSFESKFSNRRGQSLSPVLRNLNPSRALSKKPPISAAKTSSPSTFLNNDSGTAERNTRHLPKSQVNSKNHQLGSPKRSSSNASLCSSTSSSTTSTSAKSNDQRTGGRDLSRANSRLNGIWKANKVHNTPTPASSQLKRSSTYEKLNNKVPSSTDAENKSSAGPNAAIVPPFNYNGPKVRQKSQIPMTGGGSVDVNSAQLPDDDSKQPCLVTYV
ncbi:hypothetical protein CHUAL_010487 [Chamberlinius hualienensis]